LSNTGGRAKLEEVLSMKRATLAFALTVGAASAALAADMPAPAPIPPPAYVPVPPIYNWTGLYVGGNLGFRWAATHAEFRAALKVGKEAADQRVERSLYQRAVGYHYDAVKIFMPAGAKKLVYAPYVEHVPPDTIAAIFWLKNRDPAHWRDAWQLEHVTGKYVISDRPMSEEDWIRAVTRSTAAPFGALRDHGELRLAG
jgi:opacity protein-like surface antigen